MSFYGKNMRFGDQVCESECHLVSSRHLHCRLQGVRRNPEVYGQAIRYGIIGTEKRHALSETY
jgi:hypothetical protein